MNRESTDQRFMFADCAINIDPNAQELSEIAWAAATATAETQEFLTLIQGAMLSFSTKGSASTSI